MDEELIKIGFRIECLKLAVAGREGHAAKDIVAIAQEFEDFAFGVVKVQVGQ